MNKRIQDLAYQAEDYADSIVRECAELMYRRNENGNCKDGDVIKQYFGVKQ